MHNMKCKVIKPCVIEVQSGEVEVSGYQYLFAKDYLEVIEEDKPKAEKKKTPKKK